jgi:iron complex outermembrane recepter protein
VTPGVLAAGNVLNGVANPGAVSQPLRPCGPPTTQSVDSSGNVYCAQNMLDYTDVQPTETRYGALGRFTAQINPDTQVYFTASFYENRIIEDEPPAQIQNSTPINTNSIALPALLSNGSLNPNNPFASMGEAALINYAFSDLPSQIRLDNHLYRGVLGVKGSLWGWDYEASLNANRGVLGTEGVGFIFEPQLISDVQTGAYNFLNPTANTAAVRAALAPNLYKTSTSDLDSIDISATRKLFDLPGGPLSIALGGQFRYEAMHNPNINTNDEVAAGDGTIQPAYTFGHRTVGSLFFEVEAPVVKPLEINVSGRFDDYSDFGSNFSPKVGVKYTPIRQVALRGTYSEGFPAPSFSESGNSGVIGYTPYIIYTPDAAPGSGLANFIAAHSPGGVPDAYITNPYNLNGSTVGNPNIKPETSRSYTLGAVLEPTSHFNISIDYYNISKHNVIGTQSNGVILANYYGGLPQPSGVSIVLDAPDPQAPNAPRRPIVINEPYVNSNSEATDGLDIDVRANFTLPYDVQWTSELNFTDIFHFTYDNDGVTYEYAGTQAPYFLSSGAGTPKYRANWANSFTYKRLNVTGTLYYVSPYKETGVDVTGYLPGTATAPCLYATPSGAPFPTNCTVTEFWDFDLTGRYTVNDKVQLYADITNLFDAKPPLDPANYAAGANGFGMNYNPTYSQAGAVGRAFRLGIHVKY